VADAVQHVAAVVCVEQDVGRACSMRQHLRRLARYHSKGARAGLLMHVTRHLVMSWVGGGPKRKPTHTTPKGNTSTYVLTDTHTRVPVATAAHVYAHPDSIHQHTDKQRCRCSTATTPKDARAQDSARTCTPSIAYATKQHRHQHLRAY
jgi:hypothetical protein